MVVVTLRPQRMRVERLQVQDIAAHRLSVSGFRSCVKRCIIRSSHGKA
jgi:hypothetical protein